MGGGASKKKGAAERQRLEDARASLLAGRIESAVEMLESLRAKLLVPGKSQLPRKGFEGLLTELDALRDSGTKAKLALDAAHEEALVIMKDAEELLGKGEMQQAKAQFQSALEKYQAAFKTSDFAEHWLELTQDSTDTSGPQWKECHESMSIQGSFLICEDSSVGSATTGEVADGGKLVCEMRIKKMKPRPEGEDSDIFFGVMDESMGLDDFWFEDEFEDRVWFYSDDGDICTGEEALEGVAASWAYKEGDSVRLELEFTTGEDRGVLKFYKNGALIPQHFTGVEGPVIAAVLMSDCQEGDCIELVDLQYDPGQDTGEEAVQDLTEVLHQQRPVFTVMDAFASSCRAHLQYMSFREEDSKTTISAAKKALTRAIVKLQKATDKMRSSKCNSKKMELSSELKSDFLGRARAKIAEAEALVEEGKLTQSFKVFDDAIALVQKIEESGMLKEAKKARLAAVARRDLSFRNADRMMKLVRTKVASEVMATFLEGFEESVKMAAESALLFAEAGESTKATDAEITKVACEDLQRASQLANAANKSLENARITGVKHHFQKANDAFAQAAVLCTKNGCRALADMLKQLAFEAMEAFQAVEAADVESPVGMEDEDMEKAAQEYANMLDGKADEEEPDAGGSVEPCLTGVVSRRVMAPSKVFSVYVSSSIRENEPERLCLVRDVARMVRDAVVNFGFEFEFVDPFFSLFNAPEFASNFTFRARCNDVLKQCQAESAGVDFLCLMGEDDNGISFPGSIDFDIFGSVISRIPDRGELGKLRKVIIEWFKLDTNSNPRKYVILDRRKKIPNLSSIDAKKKAIGQQEWERQYAQLQKGFYEAINFQIAAMQMQKIRTGILHKLGKIDSVNMKKKCYELFCEIDVDGSGQIDVEELQTAFEQLEVKLTKDETRAFMDEFDEDRSGEIGFDEFLMIVEKLLLDAKNHEKEEPIKNVDHAKYFKESLMYQDLCDGILDRTRDVALERSVAVMWGFDPMQMGQELKYVEQGDEFDVQDSMAHLRKAQIDKKGGSDAVQKLEGVRPEWFQHIKCWQSKELAFKRLVDMEEYVEENPPDDSIAPDTPGSRGSSVLLLNVEPTVSNFEPKTPPPRELMGTFPPPPTGDLRQDGSPSREDTAKDKFGGRQIDLDAWEAMSCRKSIFLKTLSDWEFMRVVSRSKRKSFRGSTDSPFLVVQPLENHWSGSEEDIAKARDTIKRMEDKITRLTDQERRERNAMAKAKMQAEIKACEETIQCSQADVDRTMFVVLKGELEVILIEEAKSEPSSRSGSRAGSRTGSRPKTVEKKEPIKTKLAVLKRGDAFGDLTLVLGMGRDTMIQAVTPVDLALIRYDMVESLLIRNPDIQSRIMAVVNSMPPGSLNLQTHLLTRAIAPDYPTTRAIGVAMSTNKSPMVKVLTGKEVERLSKTVSTVNLPEGIQLFRQDDGQETGWGPFGDSAFLVLEGELRVEITFEDGDKQGKPAEVARIMEAGETVGEMNLVTGAPRTCTITTATACVLVEITRHQLSSTVHRDIRNDLMLYLAQPTNGNIEARILSQRTKHAMGLRQSTFLKQLSDIEIDFLAAVSKIRIEDKGACIVKQGEWGDSAFVVLRGQLRHMVAFAEGENVREVGRLKGADVFGETTLLLDYPRSSTVEVLSKTAMLAEISREAAEKMLNCRSDIVDTMEMMLHGDEGMQDIMRARTPLGGRAATPGGVVATGLKASISVVTYPWKAEANGMHAEMRGQSYIRAFAQKVANALFQRIEPALEKDHRALNDAKLPLLQECSFHLDIAARKTEVFAGRKDEMRRLVDYIEGEYQQRMGLKNQPTIVMGEAGVGKSALLANAGIKAKARNPGTICVFRFMGWSQESLNVRRMMKSILTQLMTTFGMKLPTFPDSLPELRDMLSSMLEKASKQELITLILDAVDDLETPAGFMPSFEWLPLRLPQYSSIILSLKPSSVDCVNMLNNLFTGEVYFNIYALRPVDAQPVLDGYLDKRGKPGFSNLHFETIRKASLESAGLEGVPMNCSPLFLNLCMNLSEDWISFNQCPALPDNIPDLVKLVCESLELEHGNVLIARSLSYLYTSREGLVWQELYDLLSCDDDVLEEVYKPQVPAYRRLPSFTGKLLANSLGKLLEPRFNNQVPTQKFRYRLFKHVVFERYELENTVRQCSIHRAMANYFSGEWADGKEITHLETHQWKASKDDGNKYTRGINAQSTFMEGVSRLIFHRRKRVANMRKIRELPHHICWSSGRSTKTIDPVGRALSQRPPSSWNSRHESDRNAQVMFQKHFCRLDIVEAACLAGYAFELHDDMLLAKKIFPYSELVRQFHKLVHEAIVTLAGNGHLTFQCALNSAGNGQGLINEVAHNMLQHYYAEGDRDGIPDVWFVHTNKDEVMDSLYVQYLGHWGGVFSVSISNKDDVVVTGGADCSVRLYDATSGNEVRRIDGHVEAVLRVSFSPSNKKIVSSSADMTAIIWDTVTGDQLTRLEGHDGEVLDAIFLTDMVVMTASNDSTLRTWKVDTGQMIRVFSGHKSAVTTCISMAKGTQAISSSFDKTIRIWEVDSGLELLMLAGHAGVIYGLDLSRDQRKLLSCASDQMVKVWDLDEGLEIETLHLHSYAVTSCAFDPTGCWIVTGGIDKTVRLFELNSTTDAVIIGEHTAAVCSIRFSNEGDFILSAGADGIVSKWEWAVAHQVATDSTPDHTSPICHVEFSSTGQHLISLSSDGVTILRVLDWQCCTLVAHQLTDEKDPATACKFAPNSLTVATLHAFGTLLWDTKTGNVVGRFAQQFDLYSLEFPDEVEYAIAPPMPPLVEPDGDMAGKSKTAELALEDPNAFNHAQMERLQFHARDRNKKRFRADYLAIAREINDLQGGREVDWRAAREELNRLIKDEDEKAAEKVKKQQEEARAANELKKHEELEELKRKSAFAKEHAAREAEKAIERLMGDFRFCENCGAPWVTSADSCSECSHPGPVNLSEGSCGSCIHCESEWIRAGNFCHRCGAERDRDAEDEARDLGIGNETDEAEAEENSVPANTSLKRSQPRAAISSLNWSKSEKKGAEGLFENGLHVWFDALKSIVSGTDSEVAIVRSLVQADKATLAQGKLNAEISVFGRELTAAEREAFEWNLEANVGSDRSKLVEAIQSGDAPNVAQPDENQKILKVADIAKDSPQPSGKKMSLFSSAAAKGALDSMKRSFSFKKKNDSPDVIKAKDSDNMDKKEAKEEALDSEQKQALLAESKRSDLKPAKAQAKNAPTSAASERKTLEMAKRALLHEMLRSDAEIAIFGSELEQNERDDAWKGPKKNSLKKQLIKAASIKKKALEHYLQTFLKHEGYGDIPKGLFSLESKASTNDVEKNETIAEKNETIIEEPPSESSMILTKGLSLWMSGIAKVLTGSHEEIDLVKRLLQDDEAKLLLMKANAEVSVFGRELSPDERETAWGKSHDDRLILTCLRAKAEEQVFGQPLLDDERDQAWESGENKRALIKAYSASVKRHRVDLQLTLQSIQQADQRMEQAASQIQQADQRTEQVANRQQISTIDRGVAAPGSPIQQADQRTDQAADRQQMSTIDRGVAAPGSPISRPATAVTFASDVLERPPTRGSSSANSDTSSLRNAAEAEAHARFKTLFSRATTPNVDADDRQFDSGDESRQASFPDTPVTHASRPASAMNPQDLATRQQIENQIRPKSATGVSFASDVGSNSDTSSFRDAAEAEALARFEVLYSRATTPNVDAAADSRPPTRGSAGSRTEPLSSVYEGAVEEIESECKNRDATEKHEDVNEHGSQQDEHLHVGDHQTVQTSDGQYAEIMQIHSAPHTADGKYNDPDDAVLHLTEEGLDDVDRQILMAPVEVKQIYSAPRTDDDTAQFDIDDAAHAIEKHEDANEHGSQQDEHLHVGDHQTVQTSDGQYAEIMQIHSAPHTADGKYNDPDDAVLHLTEEGLDDVDRQILMAPVEVKQIYSAPRTDDDTAQFDIDDAAHAIEKHEDANEHGSQQDEHLHVGDHQTVQTSDGQYAEIMQIHAAPHTADGKYNDPDDAELQQRISMYTDVDVEVIESRPGTRGSIHLRPRTSDSRPFTGHSGDIFPTSQTVVSEGGSREGKGCPRTGEAGANPNQFDIGERPQTSQTGRSGSRDGQSRPRPGDVGAGADASEVSDSTLHQVDVWTEAEELGTDEVDLTVTHDTALWSFNSLLKFMQHVDPRKLEEKAKKDAEQARRARLKAEARKMKSAVAQETEEKEVFDVDKPEKDVDIEILQHIMFLLDQLQATTNPGSQMHGKSTEVLIKIANERMCRRNIAFPARGIPSLNFLVIETMKPYLWHPDKGVRIVSIECLSKITRPTDAGTFKLLGQLASDEDPDVKAAAVSAISAIANADDGDDEEDMKNPMVRKMLTVTVKAANNLVAADASGTSDPFATVALQAFDADIDEIKTMRAQNFGSARELMKASFQETMEDAPAMVDLALKRMQLKRALILEMTSAWDHKEMLKECTFITLEKNKILFVQGDSIDSLFMVITGALRVMVKFDNYNKPKREEEEGASPKEMKKVPIVGKHDLGQQVALLDKGDTIGEMCLMLQEEQSASVVAAEECNILEITRQALLALKMRRPSVVTDLKIRAMKLRGQMVEESQKGPFAMRKTDVKTKTLNPVWEETFCFYNLDVSSSLVVSIFDHDIVGSHDFLGRVLLPIQSLPINQSLESWFPLQARSDDEEVSGSVCLHLRLQTDKRKRIECMDGETFVSEIDINGNTLNLMRDSSSNYADPRPATIFRLGSKIGAWHACPADPRNIAVGNHNGGVFLLRLQDYLNYRWEREALEEQAKQEQSLTTLPRSSLEPFLPAN